MENYKNEGEVSGLLKNKLMNKKQGLKFYSYKIVIVQISCMCYIIVIKTYK